MTLHYVGKDESAGYKKNCSTLGGLFSAPEVSVYSCYGCSTTYRCFHCVKRDEKQKTKAKAGC
ncbi:hypothetical protein E1A91_D09G111700v1 [Gossypium mustelinum]|uniref:Uncharacterized protein n=1 Tax=Gossypium mustelinum TaxID=34275 RepID=A0A5D2TI31_GOSMU|nr:hypothetical protein E1A91_D09G111700v1 [Gossypium mustelinum]